MLAKKYIKWGAWNVLMFLFQKHYKTIMDEVSTDGSILTIASTISTQKDIIGDVCSGSFFFFFAKP